ncbi:ATP-binding cassette domain-containing protein [Microgenomates group bacterium]|nr:ATP-binding cassette domain-containing protein [Microgenomates group bacterium]
MISFVDLTKIFAPDKVVLSGINLEIAEGDFVFLTGISGSGKTTLLNLLLGMQLPTSGEVVVDGRSLSSLKKRHVPHHRRQFGVVFQDYKLIADLTVAENIALPLLITNAGGEEIASRVADLLKLVNLSDRADFFPRQLSGGEAQRVGIARALATAPKIIFADEPTGNLDVRAATGIVKLLKKINELGTTVIISTHDPRLLALVKSGRHIHLCGGGAQECAVGSDVLMMENSLTQKQTTLDGYKEILDEANNREEAEEDEEEVEIDDEIEEGGEELREEVEEGAEGEKEEALKKAPAKSKKKVVAKKKKEAEVKKKKPEKKS